MVTTFLSIRASLVRNSYLRHRSSAVSVVLLMVILICLTVIGCVVVPGLSTGPGQRSDWAVLGGAALALTWSLSPLLLVGTDRSLSIDSLRLFPLKRRDIMAGLGLASLIALPGAALVGAIVVLMTLATVAWAVLPVAIAAGLVTILLSILARQILLDALGLVAAVRHRREVIGIAVLVIIVLGVSLVLLSVRSGRFATWMSVDGLAPLVAWTPFGAAWAVPDAMASGRADDAVAYAVVSLASVLASLAIWTSLVSRRLRPTSSGGRAVPRRGLGVLSVVPDSVVGAVAARTIIGWFRDPRYSTMWAFALVLPAFGVALSVIGDTYWLLMVYPITSLFLVATTGALDISNDGKAHAAHLTVPVSGFHDALGRLVGHVLASAPFVVLSVVVGFLVMPPVAALGFVGVTIAAAGGSLGAARATTARILVPVASGGQDAQETRPGSGLPTLVHYAASGGAACAAALVPAALTIVAGITGLWQLAAIAVVCGLILGAGAAWVGLALGSKVLNRSPQRTYAAILSVS